MRRNVRQLVVGCALALLGAPHAGRAAGQASRALTICVDPGHSRATVGTRGKKIIEYKIAWTMALKLKGELEKRGLNVLLTKRNEDENVRNEDRAAIANRAQATLFVRLHCDSASGSGIATYFPDRQGVKDGVRGPGPEVIAASQHAAGRFHRAMLASLAGALKDRGVHPDIQTNVGSKQGALTGSIFSRVPVLLVEMCVLNSAHDEAFIASEAGQKKLAAAMAEGVLAAVSDASDKK